MEIIAAVTGAALALIGALHVVWAFSPWPLATREALARNVVGRSDGSLPLGFFVPASLAVAVALAAAAYLVAAEGGVLRGALPEVLVTAGVWGVAAVLLGRGAWGLVESGLRRGDAPEAYRRLDLRCYSPLCLALGTSAAAVALL
ncbi:DUF3995 domain-containing protein [Glycomyces sp. TRM65418]|uniref:DUF3995 domain-containing protein n=1 Tax=Glycomyces sp. TRM65418 TaxID=2867006 RepID=UPI001CE5580A|nr:DUF3995 domain-containing protein [Glycomyces sp. TRM65418]MCC3765929.1 DUF3995 domain-containing protein [Glycomyces sp. TRM65418]QZD55511.1 DUF3995 domain-containing protein [Glycomyces sp. TRM65418]